MICDSVSYITRDLYEVVVRGASNSEYCDDSEKAIEAALNAHDMLVHASRMALETFNGFSTNQFDEVRGQLRAALAMARKENE